LLASGSVFPTTHHFPKAAASARLLGVVFVIDMHGHDHMTTRRHRLSRTRFPSEEIATSLATVRALVAEGPEPDAPSCRVVAAGAAQPRIEDLYLAWLVPAWPVAAIAAFEAAFETKSARQRHGFPAAATSFASTSHQAVRRHDTFGAKIAITRQRRAQSWLRTMAVRAFIDLVRVEPGASPRARTRLS